MSRLLYKWLLAFLIFTDPTTALLCRYIRKIIKKAEGSVEEITPALILL